METDFYPRSPCGERPTNRRPIFFYQTFLSTLSLRRATLGRGEVVQRMWNFYPRSPCGERRSLVSAFTDRAAYFYPRSPCGERRGSPQLCERPTTYFYPRSPCGERLSERVPLAESTAISIHALLAESDPGKIRIFNNILNFYPRSPCGERHDGLIASANFCRFLSTLSLRRATGFAAGNWPHRNFYPRSPCGERPPSIFLHCTTYLFLSTLSLRRATPPSPPKARVL